jgi:hypothetical protein
MMTENEFDDLFHAGEYGSYYETWLSVKLRCTLEEAVQAASEMKLYEQFRASMLA